MPVKDLRLNPEACETASATQALDYRALKREQQRVWLRNSSFSGSCAREGAKACTSAPLPRTTARHAEAEGLGPMPDIATGKGNITTALTVRLGIGHQFVSQFC